MSRKVKDDRTVYLSHNNFGRLRPRPLWPKIIDFGCAEIVDELESDEIEIRRRPIQQNDYTAPEVMLGTSWSYSADIWNLGVLLWDFLEARRLFQTLYEPEYEYNPTVHMAEMVALLGPPPKELLEKERRLRDIEWGPALHNREDKLCKTPCQWHGGPFFDSNEDFIRKDLIPHDVSFEKYVTVIEGEKKELFLQFIRKMLRWEPDERQSATELLEDPWLNSYTKDIEEFAS